jgi:molybdopterin converting factor subunit 1
MNALAFGIAKEIVGNSSVKIELDKSATVRDFKTLLEKEYPAFKKLGSYMIAVNNAYAADETTINLNDEVAIIPPVSGG